MQCPFCNEEIKDGAKKCRFCGEFLNKEDAPKKEETKEKVVYIEKEPEKKKKKIGCFGRGLIIFFGLAFIGALVSPSEPSSTTTSSTQKTSTTKKTYTDLNEAYKDHKYYIWTVAQEGVKLISTNQVHNFQGPTYAGTPDGENFLIEGTDNGKSFACVFQKADNERGMEIYNCAWVE